MKIVVICAAWLCLGMGLAIADNETPGTPDSLSNAIPEYHNLVAGPGLPMGAGMENVITFNYLTETAIDRSINNHWFSEDRAVGKAGGVFCRLIKNIYVDMPLDYFSVVFSHEYFGHGARYRELWEDNIDYGYDAPPPYGGGGGHATAYINDPITYDELMAIFVGGIETQAIINHKLNMRWMAQKEARYREASLYFWSFQIMYDYVRSTGDPLGEGRDDRDPAEYLYWLNTKAGVADLDNPAMRVSELKSRSTINLVNPFLVFSIYSQLKTYLWDGNTVTSMPMIHVGHVGYLPALRLSLTPFGPQYHLENYVRHGSRVTLVDLHLGDNTFYDSWGGVGLQIQNAFQKDRLSLDIDCNAWKQPGVELTRNGSGVVGDGIGGAVAVTAHYDLSRVANPLTAAVQVGYKSAGFLEGHDLDASPIISIGFGYRH
ncbi:MAG: hypothetical protein KKA42_06260 [candidate division Zixibacteria bacterium]|nr:hypothetical protein [candidate division Zixibacteria bacterium]